MNFSRSRIRSQTPQVFKTCGVSKLIVGDVGLLFGVDMITNVADYAFHLFLGRALSPGDFAVVQAVNAAVLIVVTAFAVTQPVVARYVAEAAIEGQANGRGQAVFQLFFGQSALAGLLLTLLALAGRETVAGWLNVPPAAVALSAAMLFLALVRPVVAGMLQGQQRFVPFGLTRTAFSLGRLLLAVAWVGWWGGGALAGVATIPLAAGLALVAGLLFLGRPAWQPGPALPRDLVRQGWRLSLAALVAYGAYTSLQSVDVIWVNRAFDPALAGGYATAAVLRRVLALLPGAAVVILYPRVVALVARRELPDRLLAQTAAVILVTTASLAALYFVLAEPLVGWLFGPEYLAASPLLGWMGLAMVGYGLGAVWLNVFLATRPWPFVWLLAGAAAGQLAFLAAYHATLAQVTAIFAAGGWVLALAGALLYLAWLRPALKRQGGS